MSIESEVLNIIVPPEEECKKVTDTAKKLKSIVEKYLSERNIQAEVKSVGSVAKGTFLDDPDLDMFILFPEDVPKKELERIGIQAGRDIINGEMMYAEHPYTTGSFEGYEVDLVPCYKHDTTENLMSAVDRTPFHTDFILKHSDETLRNEMRLMKRFMKGIKAYGAEPNIRGFSGYLCEVITYHYGSFIETVKAASKWKKGTVLAPVDKGPIIKEPLVVYDPVDSKRNVASAVHLDTLSKFIIACREYLKSPSMKFFFPEKRTPYTPSQLKEMIIKDKLSITVFSFDRPEGEIPENIYAQTWKTQYSISKKLDTFGFISLRAVNTVTEDRILMAFETETDTLPSLEKRDGPPISAESSDNFLRKWSHDMHKVPYIEDGCWHVIADRAFRDIPGMIKREKESVSVGKAFDKESMRIIADLDEICTINPDLITELLDPKFPWEI